jgi:hypothetical protein
MPAALVWGVRVERLSEELVPCAHQDDEIPVDEHAALGHSLLDEGAALWQQL